MRLDPSCGCESIRSKASASTLGGCLLLIGRYCRPIEPHAARAIACHSFQRLESEARKQGQTSCPRCSSLFRLNRDGNQRIGLRVCPKVGELYTPRLRDHPRSGQGRLISQRTIDAKSSAGGGPNRWKLCASAVSILRLSRLGCVVTTCAIGVV